MYACTESFRRTVPPRQKVSSFGSTNRDVHATLTQTVMRDEILLAPPFRVTEEQDEEAFRDGPGAYHRSPVYGQPGVNNPWIRKSHNVYIQQTLDRNTDSWLKATRVRSQSKFASQSADLERRYSSRRPKSGVQAAKKQSTRLPKKNLAPQFDHQTSTQSAHRRPQSSRSFNARSVVPIPSPQASSRPHEEAGTPQAYSMDALSKAIANALKSEGKAPISDDAVRAAVEQTLASMLSQDSQTTDTSHEVYPTDKTSNSKNSVNGSASDNDFSEEENRREVPTEHIELQREREDNSSGSPGSSNSQSAAEVPASDAVTVSMSSSTTGTDSLEVRIRQALEQ